jgi:hypothetical protein
MVDFGTPIIQINLHHSKSVSAILTRSIAVVQTSIAIIQEPWLVKGTIRGLVSCDKVLRVNTEDKTRTCIITKGVDATLSPQLSCDLTAVQLRFKLMDGIYRHVIIGSAYMPYDSEDLPPQEEIKKLVAYAEDKGLELLLGCDANCHHEVWGSIDINPRGESLLDFTMHTRQHILNREKEPTFLDSRRQEVLDIAICTRGLVGPVRDWRVSSEPSGSDHRQIRFTL